MPSFSLTRKVSPLRARFRARSTEVFRFNAWLANGLHLPVSVNVSALQLQQANFVETLLERLRAYPGLQPGSLLLEVLETNALEDIQHVSALISACDRLGVGFALDDFGTGYSSLIYLKHLPVQELKIDQSFVRDMLHDPEDLAILRGVRGLAQAFRRQVVAEGVETEQHGAMRLNLGCDLGQGYGIARPMPAEQIPDWANAWRPPRQWSEARRLPDEDMPILYAGIEHRAWMKNILSFIDGGQGERPQLDPHQCHFGHWIDNLRREDLNDGTRERLGIVKTSHAELHEIGSALLQAHADGDAAEVAVLLPRLQAISARLQDLLAQHLAR